MFLMEQTMRWYGPQDPVPLSSLRQAGCTGVVSALHQVPVGAVWAVEAIEERKRQIDEAGMTWTVIESLPVSEDIKRQSGQWKEHLSHYKQSLVNVGQCGLKVVTYNFMPILDWLRTDIAYPLPDGSKALYFERLAFIVFDVFLLQRPGADKDYSAAELDAARKKKEAMSAEDQLFLFKNMLLGLPGSDESFTPEQVLSALKEYAHIHADQLRKHLTDFLEEIIPVAEKAGVVMAIHPDDPPYPVLGLPRIVSTESDAAALLEAVPSAANGLCFCTGSYGARADNNLVEMIRRFGNRIHFLHLRNTKRDADGNFYEATHLGGDSNMFAIVHEIVALQQQRGCSLPMRPDHGHQMLDDLHKKTYPGYSAIGRLKGLAELRGLEYGLSQSWLAKNS